MLEGENLKKKIEFSLNVKDHNKNKINNKENIINEDEMININKYKHLIHKNYKCQKYQKNQ